MSRKVFYLITFHHLIIQNVLSVDSDFCKDMPALSDDFIRNYKASNHNRPQYFNRGRGDKIKQCKLGTSNDTNTNLVLMEKEFSKCVSYQKHVLEKEKNQILSQTSSTDMEQDLLTKIGQNSTTHQNLINLGWERELYNESNSENFIYFREILLSVDESSSSDESSSISAKKSNCEKLWPPYSQLARIDNDAEKNLAERVREKFYYTVPGQNFHRGLCEIRGLKCQPNFYISGTSIEDQVFTALGQKSCDIPSNAISPKQGMVHKNNDKNETIILTPNWEISFGIYLLGTRSDWSSLVFVALSDQTVTHWPRLPAIFFSANSYRLAFIYSNNCQPTVVDGNLLRHTFKKNYFWQTGEYHEIKMTSTQVFGSVDDDNNNYAAKITIHLDGILEHEAIWNDLCFGKEAKVYTSDPWFEPANVAMVNFKIDMMKGSNNFAKFECTCQFGDPGSGCISSGQEKCLTDSCHANYHFDNDTETCKENVCHCDNGNGATGSNCPVHDGFKCSDCLSGYHLIQNAGNSNASPAFFTDYTCQPLLTKINLIDTVPISSTWEFSFGIHLAGTVPDTWTNLIQIITTGQDSYINIPGIFFMPNSYKFYMNFSKGCQDRTSFIHDPNLNANNYNFIADYGWQTGEFHKIKLKSSAVENDITASKIKIILDDIIQEELTYTGLCFGQMADIYLSNHVNPPAKVVLVDFEYDFVSCEVGYQRNTNHECERITTESDSESSVDEGESPSSEGDSPSSEGESPSSEEESPASEGESPS